MRFSPLAFALSVFAAPQVALAASDWQARLDAQYTALSNAQPELVATIETMQPRMDRARRLTFVGGAMDEPGAYPAALHRLVRGDDDPTVRLALANTLARHNGHAEWGDAFAGLYAAEQDGEMRLALLPAAKNLPAHSARTMLTAASADSDATIRAEAIRVAGWRKDAPEFQQLLIGAMTDTSSDVRLTAARAIGWHGIEAGTDALWLLVDDSSAEVRMHALSALARLQPRGLADHPKVRALQQDPSADVARVAKRIAAQP